MDKMNNASIIPALKRKWVRCTVVADLCIAAGTAFLLSVVSTKWLGWWYGCGIGYFAIALGILLLLHRVWRVKETAIAQLLDEHYPQLEESSTLLLQPFASLSLLQQLQYQRTGQALSSVAAPLNVTRKLIPPIIAGLLLTAAGIALYKTSFAHNKVLVLAPPGAVVKKVMPEKVLPQLAGIAISIVPPAYTGRHSREQQAFNLQAEEGSMVEWKLQTNIAANHVTFIFNDTLQVSLRSSGTSHTQWMASRKIDSSGFYQSNIDGKISELYKMETIKDQPPVVLLQSPKQYTTIDIGEPQLVKINTSLTDDYGIKDASIAATIASGSGEAVKFKEQKMALPGFVAGKTQYQLQQLLSLPQMGMHPGDELYFYVQATDNHQQQTRSDIYIVHLPDTAQLMSLEGMANSITLKPEYFRSQRQIIIETEQLLKDKDTISQETFKNRSNNLGIDQKLLRLRYSKFLGDEAESGDNDTHELQDIANFSNADKVRDAYTDKHDNAEDASFYDAATKKQLRATLDQMWNAEIQLRTFLPTTALPFEYKALRLLKDLQQQSRAYVAKANFKTTPLDLKKRLSGDLSKIEQSTQHEDLKKNQDAQLPVRRALAVLEDIKSGNSQSIDNSSLQQANLLLHERAMQQPGLYLAAVEALKRIMAQQTVSTVAAPDLLAAEQGLQQLLSLPGKLPSAAKGSPARALSKQYFDNLQKQQP